MDAIVKQIGLKSNCTFCGVFRRQALDRGALLVKADKIVTGKYYLRGVFRRQALERGAVLVKADKILHSVYEMRSTFCWMNSTYECTYECMLNE